MKGQPSSIWVTIFVALATLPVKGGTQSFSNKDHDSQQGKQATNNTYGIFSRITNHVGSIPMFLQGQCEGEQYHDRFLALLDASNIQCAGMQSIRYWYEYMPTSVIQRLSRSSGSNELSSIYPLTDEWLYIGNCLIRFFSNCRKLANGALCESYQDREGWFNP